MVIDFISLKKDNDTYKSGNWITTNNTNITRCKNFIKIQPNELVFLPEGIPIFPWLSLKLKLSINSFLIWLKQELLNYNFLVKDITYKISLQGDLILNIILIDNNSFKILSPLKVD